VFLSFLAPGCASILDSSAEKLCNQNGEDTDEQWEARRIAAESQVSGNSRVRMKAEREHNEWPA
jgi:hypothetical protein